MKFQAARNYLITKITNTQKISWTSFSLPLRHSKSKPFCDGSHADVGFKAEETASQAE